MARQLNPQELSDVKNRIADAFDRNTNMVPVGTQKLLSRYRESISGKLYEVFVLAHFCEILYAREKCKIKFRGTELRLRTKGEFIDRRFLHFLVRHPNASEDWELFTDIYFSGISHDAIRRNPKNRNLPAVSGDYHELDIALVRSTVTDLPGFNDVIIAIECKDRKVEKSTIREILGYRRELSFVTDIENTTPFKTWPVVKANPASVHLVYSSHSEIRKYIRNCEIFGTLLEYLPM